MKKSNLILLAVAILLVVAGGVYFISNMNEESATVEEPETPGFTDSSGSGEPSVVETPQEPASAVEIGMDAPDFTLSDMEGNQVSLSDYKGKLVFLNFWATWCQYCDIEMPDLQKMNEENEDLVVLAVNVREDVDLVKTYLDEGGYTFPVVLDEDGDIASLYLVSGMPTTYFLNSDGLILGYLPGMMTLEQMEDALSQMRDLEGQL